MKALQKRKIEQLRSHITGIEAVSAQNQKRSVELWPGVAGIAGVLHEVRADDWRHTPSAVGFSLALAQGLAQGPEKVSPSRDRPHLARAAAKPLMIIEKTDEARGDGAIYAPGLAALGFDPRSILFVEARHDEKVLWAAEEALRAGGLGAVVILVRYPGALLGLTATRRLHLAGEASGVTPVLVRAPCVAGQAQTCAPSRWRVSPIASRPAPLDLKSPGAPAWRVSVEKAPHSKEMAMVGERSKYSRPFLVEWRHDKLEFVEVIPAEVRLAPSQHHEAGFGPLLSSSVHGSVLSTDRANVA